MTPVLFEESGAEPSAAAQQAAVRHFLDRRKPRSLPPDWFALRDWECGSEQHAVAVADDLRAGRFRHDDGRVEPFDWSEPGAWSGVSGPLRFALVRGELLGHVCRAWHQTQSAACLRLFERFYAMQRQVTAPRIGPLDLSTGDSAFFGGPDPNLPWLREDWGPWQNPMNTGFRMLRYWRIWDTGIFAHLPVRLAYDFLADQWRHLLLYQPFTGYPQRAGNHYLFEIGTAPYLCAGMMPEFAACRAMMKTAARTINDYLRRWVFPDGSYVEHSSGYTVVAWGDLLAPYCWARHNGIQLLPPRSQDRLRRFDRFVCDLFHANGDMSQFGDSMPAVFAESVGGMRKPLRRHGFAPDGARRPAYYPHAGFAMLGDARSSLLVSALNRHLPRGHVHWEHLSFELCANGRVWIGDPASVLRSRESFTRPHIYSGNARRAPARQYHYSLAAHNTVLIDDLNPGDEPFSEHEFGGCPPACHGLRFQTAPLQQFSAAHSVYQALGIRQRRTFTRLSSDAYLIEDCFTGQPDRRVHRYCTRLHVMPGIGILPEGEAGVRLSWKGAAIRILFTPGDVTVEPDHHVRAHARTAAEAELGILCHRTRHAGTHRSACLLILGDRPATAAEREQLQALAKHGAEKKTRRHAPARTVTAAFLPAASTRR